MRLDILTDRIRDYERTLAPGSETALWGEYVEQMRDQVGVSPLRDLDDYPDVPEDEAAWWIGAYRALEHGVDPATILWGGDDYAGWVPPLPTAEAIRAWREAEGLTQERAAALAGVTRVAWARWEGGTRPVPDTLVDLLRQRWGSAP